MEVDVRYSWGASRDEQIQKLVYGAFRDLGFSVVRMGGDMPHFLVAKDGHTAFVLVADTKLDGTKHKGKKPVAVIRAFMSWWQGEVYEVATQADVVYAANRIELTAKEVALAAARCNQLDKLLGV